MNLTLLVCWSVIYLLINSYLDCDTVACSVWSQRCLFVIKIIIFFLVFVSSETLIILLKCHCEMNGINAKREEKLGKVNHMQYTGCPTVDIELLQL